MKIHYKKGYKYQLTKDYGVAVDIKPAGDIVSQYIELLSDGNLIIRCGYSWDGPSGPTIDTKNFMRGSLIHDALYQLMRENKLDECVCRRPADLELWKACREDGMSWVRAGYVYLAVRWAAKRAATKTCKLEETAP